MKTANALDIQVAGTHYKEMKIQPVEFIHANGIGFCEATAIKYLCRWKRKGGIQDLQKAKHFIDVLIELETRDKPTPITVQGGPYCTNIGCENLADFREEYNCYWCSDCACRLGVDTSTMTMMGTL